MTFQFEDDSALEELLNQQLDRSKRLTSSANPSSKSTSTRLRQDKMTIPKVSGLKNVIDTDTPPISLTQNSSSGTGSNKFSSWLNPRKQEIVDDDIDYLRATDNQPDSGLQGDEPAPEIRRQSSSANPTRPIGHSIGPIISVQVQRDERIDSSVGLQHNRTYGTNNSFPTSNQIKDSKISRYNDQEVLQQMSKQGLIRIILDEIMPEIQKQTNQMEDHDKLRAELHMSKAQLDEELLKRQSIQKDLEERARLAETSWIQLNRQLESRLDLSQKELKDTIARYESLMSKLEEERSKQIQSIMDNYNKRLNDQDSKYEAEIKRRETIHELEMSSRLRVQGDLDKLDGVFECWQSTIENTIKQLENQFKSIESLLDKQTSKIRWNNDQILEKSIKSEEQTDKIVTEVVKFGQLSDSIKTLLDKIFTNVNSLHDHDNLLRRANDNLNELKLRSIDLDNKQHDLQVMEKNLQEQKFELKLEMQRIDMDKLRLVELRENNEMISRKIDDREVKLSEAEIDVKKRKLTTEYERIELDQSREKLSLDYKAVRIKQQELEKMQIELGQDRRLLRKQASKLTTDINRLATIKVSAQKELEQLRRLQKSLVCSICLDRLYEIDPNYGQNVDRNAYQVLEAERNRLNRYVKHKVVNMFDSNAKFSPINDILNIGHKLEREHQDILKESKFVELLHDKNANAACEPLTRL